MAAMDLGLTPVALDDRGLPRLLRAESVAPAPAATATDSAKIHLGRLAAAWGVRDTAMPALQGLGEVPVAGTTIARVRQSIDGLPVDGELRVMLRAGGELVATNGILVGADTPHPAPVFAIDDAAAVARAVAHNYKLDFPAAALAQRQLRSDGSRMIGGTSGNIDVQLARAKKAWQYTGTSLVPVWIVEAYASYVYSTNGDAFRTVLSADGATVLAHRSLVSDVAFTYRVYAETTGEFHPFDGPIQDSSPHPTGIPNGQIPPFVPSNLVTVDGLNHPADHPTVPDPWLVSGRTETLGNNVEAYTDMTAPNGFTFGDFRATVTGTRTFNRTYDTAQSALSSQAQQMAAITSMFYIINWQHDFWYDHGFTETAGNAQDSNYGRGGEDRDAILAEVQDNAPNSLNNANMATPSDGFPPRTQMFVWTGRQELSLTISPANRTPAVRAPSLTVAIAPLSFDVNNAPVILGTDGTAPANDGCQAITNNVAGRIVLVDLGGCTPKTKARNIQQAGGVGMLLADTANNPTLPAIPNDTAITTPITIGSFSISLAEGTLLKSDLSAGPVTATMHRLTPLLDGGLDATVISHEYGHYLHHRLQSCGTLWCGAMSEGWGDFNALMLIARPGDNLDGAYPFSIYTTPAFSNDPAYFGIRRAPYSVDPAINSLSYRHMADGEPLPTNHPFLVFGNNAEVHNAGEIWAETMWEVYVALQKAGTNFDTVRGKMADYVVGGLLMAPDDSTPDEMRDALLTVAGATSEADRMTMLQAFARRGLGSCAVTPGRESSDFIGIVESAVVAGHAVTGPVAMDASVTSCDDDQVLDNGETAKITVPISNRGHVALTEVEISVTSTSPGVTVKSKDVKMASFAVGASQDVSFDVTLDNRATAPVAGDFVIHIKSKNGCADTIDIPFVAPLNTDDQPESSATDSFDTVSTVWTATKAPIDTWTQVRETGLDGIWHGADTGAVSDITLESPALLVGTSAPFVVTFKHRYAFEFSDATAWDGGVIEYTTDGGATWADVATLGAATGYSHTLFVGADNPLAGRMAYGNKNAAYPNTDTVTLNFGTQLAGKTVKLRFRIGTDVLVAAPGWEIDDVAVTGITNKPFPTLVANKGSCAGPDGPGGPELPPDELPGGCCDAGPMRGSSLALVAGVMALLFRRRRRR